MTDLKDDQQVVNGESTKGSASDDGRKDNKPVDIEAAKAKFDIPDGALELHKPLVELVLLTDSMNDDERQYWFHIMPIMTDDQVNKLRTILVDEQRKLAKLNEDYNENITTLNEKFLQEWKDSKITQRRTDLKKAETTAEQVEAEAEANILSQLENM